MRKLLPICGIALLCSSCTNDFGAFSFSHGDSSLPRETSIIPVDATMDITDIEAGAQQNGWPRDAATDSGDAANDATGTDATGDDDSG